LAEDSEKPRVVIEAVADHPGWYSWNLPVDGLYNSFLGDILVRRDPDDAQQALVRMAPEKRHSNLAGHVHGGTMMGFIDISLFAAMRVLRNRPGELAVTLDCQVQFLGAARVDEPLEAQLEVTRETGRFMFMRGLVKQGADTMSSFTAVIKKAPKGTALQPFQPETASEFPAKPPPESS